MSNRQKLSVEVLELVSDFYTRYRYGLIPYLERRHGGIIKYLRDCGYDNADIRQECMCRLLDLAPAYRPWAGVKFSTYALAVASGTVLSLWNSARVQKRSNDGKIVPQLSQLITDTAFDDGSKTISEVADSYQHNMDYRDASSGDTICDIELLNALIQQMPEQTQYIVRARHGIGMIEMTAHEIAEQLGLSVWRVHKLYNGALYKLRSQIAFCEQVQLPTGWTELDVLEFRRLYNLGTFISNIATKLGRTIEDVEQMAARLAPYMAKEWTAEENETLLRLYNSGAKCKTIAEQLGRSCGAVSAQLKRLRDKGEMAKYKSSTT